MDYGFCKGIRKDGAKCTMVINKFKVIAAAEHVVSCLRSVSFSVCLIFFWLRSVSTASIMSEHSSRLSTRLVHDLERG
jgi:hypothetical protein